MNPLLLLFLLHPITDVCKSISLPPYYQSNCVQSLVTVLQKSTKITFSQQHLKKVSINYSTTWNKFSFYAIIPLNSSKLTTFTLGKSVLLRMLKSRSLVTK